jgi:hypothetical protein
VRQKTKQEDLMVRYLLGDLNEEEQIQIEEQFFADNRYFEQLQAVEDALIDDYAQGVLTEYERRKVEGLLRSSPQQAREIEFVQDLIRYVSEGPSEEVNKQSPFQTRRPRKSHPLLAPLQIRNPWKQFFLVVAVLSVVVVLLMAIWNLTLQRKIGQMAANQALLEKRDEELQQQIDKQEDSHGAIVKELERERRKRDQLEQELASLQESKSKISTNEIAILYLRTNSFSRGGGELRMVHVPPGFSRLQIRINLGKKEGYKSYSAVIKTFDGREIWRRDQISPRQANLGRLVLTLPGNIFVNDDYILMLRGQAEAGDVVEIGDYSFRIKR